jgi:hypothetical protein
MVTNLCFKGSIFRCHILILPYRLDYKQENELISNMLILIAIVCCILAATTANAGSSFWEQSVRIQSPHPVERLELDEVGHAVKNNETHDAIVKRYGRIVAHNTLSKFLLWPNAEITYCYATKTARDVMKPYVDAAIDVWHRHGAHPAEFKFKELTKSWWRTPMVGEECTNHPQRELILVIYYDPDGGLSTSLALQAPNRFSSGPSTHLTDRDDLGWLDVTANVVHELGHAWGLLHEHQNPYLWTQANGWEYYAVTGPLTADSIHDYDGRRAHGQPGFGTTASPFRCQDLKDYPEMVAKVEAQFPNLRRMQAEEIQLTCSSRTAAASKRFSASNWLPFPPAQKDVFWEYTSSAAWNNLDWASVMLYPSGAGAVGGVFPPELGLSERERDHRFPILVDGNGNSFPRYNLVPSTRDIQGLRRLYKDKYFPHGDPLLPNNVAHKLFAHFRNAWKRANCVQA